MTRNVKTEKLRSIYNYASKQTRSFALLTRYSYHLPGSHYRHDEFAISMTKTLCENDQLHFTSITMLYYCIYLFWSGLSKQKLLNDLLNFNLFNPVSIP